MFGLPWGRTLTHNRKHKEPCTGTTVELDGCLCYIKNIHRIYTNHADTDHIIHTQPTHNIRRINIWYSHNIQKKIHTMLRHANVVTTNVGIQMSKTVKCTNGKTGIESASKLGRAVSDLKARCYPSFQWSALATTAGGLRYQRCRPNKITFEIK